MKKLLIIFFVSLLATTALFSQTFIENKGQFESNIHAIHKNSQYNLWITDEGLYFDFYKVEEEPITRENIGKERETRTTGQIIKLEFPNSNKEAKFIGNEIEHSNSHYLVGGKKINNITNYKSAFLKNIYDNIDLELLFDEGNFRFNFIVNPEGNPDAIQMRYVGQDELTIENDDLPEILLSTQLGKILFKDIAAFQKSYGTYTTDGIENENPKVKLQESTDGTISFKIDNYDTSKKLVIDPMVFATYAGGTSTDQYNDVYVENGYMYVAGYTVSTDFPTTTGAYSTSNSGNRDIVIAKYDRDGSTLLYSTYIGDTASDEAHSLVVKDGEVTVVGKTYSNNFVPNAFQSKTFQFNNEGNGDGFIVRLNTDGSELKYISCFGGDNEDCIYEIEFDINGDLVFVGSTNSDKSSDFPVRSSAFQFQSNTNSTMDAFVSRMPYDAMSLTASTLFGDAAPEEGYGVTVDFNNDIYIVGRTEGDFGHVPTQNALMNSFVGLYSGFIVKFGPNLEKKDKKYISYFHGPDDWDIIELHKIKVDNKLNIFISGISSCENSFPATNGVVRPVSSDPYTFDCFVVKFSTDSPNMIYSTLLGGTGEDYLNDLAISSAGEAIITGKTETSDYHTTANAQQTTSGGKADAFMTVLSDDATSITYSTYLGGSEDDEGCGIFYDCELYLAGTTKSNNFSVTNNAPQSSNGGNFDAWLAKFNFSEATLTLTSPAEGAYNLNPFVEFEVSSLAQGDTWILQLSTQSDFESIILEESFETTNIRLSEALAANTVYYWRAKKVVNGFCGDWSSSKSFKTSRFDMVYNWDWQQPELPNFNYTSIASDTQTMIASTEEGAILLKNNNTSWKVIEAIEANSLDNLSFGNTDSVWVHGLGYDGNQKIYRSFDAGVTWKEIYSNTTSNISALTMVTTSIGFFGTTGGDIYKTTDGGNNWNNLTTGVTDIINDIFFSDELLGWAVTSVGDILKTVDGGANWTVTASGVAHLSAIEFYDSNNGIAVGNNGAVVETANGGTNWINVNLGVQTDFKDAFIDAPASICLVGANAIYKKNGIWTDIWDENTHGSRSFTAACNHNGTNFLAGSAGEVVQTDLTANFTTLSKESKPVFYTVAQAENTVITAGKNVQISYDNGKSWTDISAQFTEDIHYIQILKSGYGYAATNRQYMYKSTDGGATWTRFDTQIQKPIYGIHFVDNNTGFLAMDNDVYLTEDGGTTWTMTTSNNFPDIRSICFEGGTLYLANNELWKSNNMGNSWSEINYNMPTIGRARAFAKKENAAAIGGDHGIVNSTDGGATWRYTKNQNNIRIIDIEILNDSTMWALSSNGTVLKYNKSEMTWNEDNTKSNDWLKNLYIYNNLYIWGVGDKGTVLRPTPSLQKPDIFYHSIPLKSGWNFISTYVNPISTNITDILSSLDHLLLMKNGHNQLHFPNFNIFQIKEFDFKEAYYIYCTEVDTLEISGTYDAFDQPEISLKAGWNQIAYTLDYSIPITDAFENLKDSQGNRKFLLVRDFNSGIYFPDLKLNTIKNMTPGQGYMIYMLEDVDDFKYPTPASN